MEAPSPKIAKALVAAQKAFGPALKSSTNPHFRSKYAALDACVEAVIDGLNGSGIFLMQRNHPYERGVAVETVFIHESGESYSSGILQVPAQKMDPQGYGSALTYARRYSLMAACGIAPEDDDGNHATKTYKQAPPQRAQQPVAVSFDEKFNAVGGIGELEMLWNSLSPAEKKANEHLKDQAKNRLIRVEDPTQILQKEMGA